MTQTRLIERACAHCSKSFKPRKNSQKYCSHPCVNNSHKRLNTTTRQCPNCKKLFIIPNSYMKRLVYGQPSCGNQCRLELESKQRAANQTGHCCIKCTMCGNVKVIRTNQLGPNGRNFCNQECLSNYRRNVTDVDHMIPVDKLQYGPHRKHARLRLRAVQAIDADMRCHNCGCNQIGILEINHKSLGGREEQRRFQRDTDKFYRMIIKGERKKDDLEILCRVCNALHYVQAKGFFGIKVTFEQQNSHCAEPTLMEFDKELVLSLQSTTL